MSRVLVLLFAGMLVGPLAAQVVLPGSLPPLAAPPPAQTLQENLRSFDPQQVRLAWNNRRWQIVHNGEVIKDFGFNDHEARLALRLIQDLHLDQQGTVGSPTPVMEYWLAKGQAPQVPLHSILRTLTFDPARLRVEQVQGQWCVREGARVLFTFGPNAQDAQQALAVLRKYRFEQVGILGQVQASMYVFFVRAQGPSSSQARLPADTHAGRQLTAPHFSRLSKNADGSPRMEKGKQVPTTGLEGVVQPLLPGPRAPVVQPVNATRWHSQPHVGSLTTAGADGRVKFDWRQVQLREDQGEWLLMAGGTVLGNFGANLVDARLALQAVRYYRFTEQWRGGGAQPALIWFVAPSAAPRALMLGLHGEPFQPDKVEIRTDEAGCALAQGNRVLLRIRGPEADARKLLDTIKQHRCDQLCQVGEPGKEAMTILVRSR